MNRRFIPLGAGLVLLSAGCDGSTFAAFLDRGLLATINTDDPVVSDIDLDSELEVAAPRAGLSKEHVRRAQQNAVEIAFLTQQEKEGLIDAANADTRRDAVGNHLDRE